ncbi:MULTISPECIES: sigma factor [unclassified Paenibacillus]|uniref:sigma factor n=1 Tax=unclassified Paenibacillus TaxID=185978 RepID=UPI00020D7945|nr:MULTISPECIES: sigma factor [unclassified Paenibacillus]EGL15671.1 Sigma-70 region 2 [Paenibacillus sp. HGF7]EPD88370.1 hypothetical protein HMPREF1207_02544 [Paenibacillus sp. HGH0039]
MNDEQLEHWLDRLAGGDQEAMEEIYRMTRRKVYGTVAVLVSNKEDVNDIVSEIYCQLWRALPGYDRSRPFHFWLNGIVIRQVSSLAPSALETIPSDRQNFPSERRAACGNTG